MTLGKRMKRYEEVAESKLMTRCPVIIRLDGKAFHTFSKGLEKPFDKYLTKTMQDTLLDLCESSISGVVFGYTQSDEITLILQDYKELNTSAWSNYRVQKMASTSAALATLFFNKNWSENISHIRYPASYDFMGEDKQESFDRKYKTYHEKEFTAVFDARVFNVPFDDVVNNLIWRQQDARRNSIQALAQANFKQKELQKVSAKDLIVKLEKERSVKWEDLPTTNKLGTVCKRSGDDSRWELDYNIPDFREDRDYINKTFRFEENC